MYRDKEFKIKLILPCRFELDNQYYLHYLALQFFCHLPYGLSVLAHYLRKHNYYVKQEDLSIRFNRRMNTIDLEIIRNIDVIREFFDSGEVGGKLGLFIDKILGSACIERFDLIGFSLLSEAHFIFALMFSRKIKQKTNCPIVFGGPFISLYGHLYPEAFNFIDYMIVGDGRVPLLGLIEYLKKNIDISKVPNLTYKDNGKLVINPTQHYAIEDIPIPDFSDLPLKLYKNPSLNLPRYNIRLPYQISRGCSTGCSFCIYKRIHETLEFKSYGKVLNDLSQMKERYKSNNFHFCDETINNSYEYLDGLCDILIKNRLGISWSGEAKIGNLDKYILRKMKKAGCYSLEFGIESGSDRIRTMMNKASTAEIAGKTLNDASEAGIKNFINLIVGYPHETQEDIKQTCDFIRKNRKFIHYTTVYKFILLYGSPIYNNPEKYGIMNLAPSRPRFCFAFDESGGLKWQQKQEQQVERDRQVMKVVYRNAGLLSSIFVLAFQCLRLFRYIIAKIKNYVS